MTKRRIILVVVGLAIAIAAATLPVSGRAPFAISRGFPLAWTEMPPIVSLAHTETNYFNLFLDIIINSAGIGVIVGVIVGVDFVAKKRRSSSSETDQVK